MEPSTNSNPPVQSGQSSTKGAIGNRPYSLVSFVEFVAGPMPKVSDPAASHYRLLIQGMYNDFLLKERIATVTTDGQLEISFTERAINRRWWIRKAHSGLTVSEADQLACAAGVHPAMIWSSWFDDALAELDELSDSDWKQIVAGDARKTRQLLDRAANAAA